MVTLQMFTLTLGKAFDLTLCNILLRGHSQLVSNRSQNVLANGKSECFYRAPQRIDFGSKLFNVYQ